MRLINTKSYEMEEFVSDQIPEYAILSHTWEEGEVTFQEWKDIRRSTRKKPGFVKIMGACRQAKKDGLDWLWVDTNCIDKSSSSELSEAINSMFPWYRDSKICYAYLQDIPSISSHNKLKETLALFRRSRWFLRGWTLQELLAPVIVVFYDRDWNVIGVKAQVRSYIWHTRSIGYEYTAISLISEIAQTTGIDESFLDGSMSLNESSVAQRLSWVANRKTTRVEDIAYCLLGIFDINMPLLYGEGMKAFTRLQHEIIKVSSDHTIFCWTWNDQVPDDWAGMLAPFPSLFAGSRGFVRKDGASRLHQYSMTNIGLSIELPVVYSCSYVYAILNAGVNHREAYEYEYAAIPLRIALPHNQFDRCHFPEKPLLLDLPGVRRDGRINAVCEHLIVRSIRDGPRRDLRPLTFSRYGVFVFVDPQFTLISVTDLHLYLRSKPEYFRMESYNALKGESDAIGLERIKGDWPETYGSIVTLRGSNCKLYILFVVRPASPKSALPDRWSCRILPDSLITSNMELNLRDNFLKATKTSDIAQDRSCCIELGGTVMATSEAELRIARISCCD